MIEVWKAVSDYEGSYEVSDQGRVRSLDRIVFRGDHKILRHGKILKPNQDKDGYLQIALFKNGVKKAKKVHRLVAFSFNKNVENKKQVNHLNLDKADNRSSNLEWCTSKENYTHAAHHGLHHALSNSTKAHKLNIDKVYEIKELHARKWLYKDIAKKFNVCQATICRVINNNHWKEDYV